MQRRDYGSDDGVISESGNWNVAEKFSHLMIMGPIANCKVYHNIALYGYDSFFEELSYISIPVDELRLKGLIRLINELIDLCETTFFAMKKKGTKEILEKHWEMLIKIRNEMVPNLFKYVKNEAEKTREIKFDHRIFDAILAATAKIRSKIYDPLNQNHLIFVDKDEFDPVAFKNKKRERMINQG